MTSKQLKLDQDEFVDWCFTHMDGTESKLELGLKIWIHQAREIHRLANKLARLEEEHKSRTKSKVARPTRSKKPKN